jgi:hypothetical protein
MSSKKAQPTSATPIDPTADEKIAALETEIKRLKDKQAADEPKPHDEGAPSFGYLHESDWLALRIMTYLTVDEMLIDPVIRGGEISEFGVNFSDAWFGVSKLIKDAVLTNQFRDTELQRDLPALRQHKSALDEMATSFREVISQEPPIDPLPRLWAAVGAFEGSGLDAATTTTPNLHDEHVSEKSFADVIAVQFWLKTNFERLTPVQQATAKKAYIDAHFAEYTRRGIGKFANEGQNTAAEPTGQAVQS